MTTITENKLTPGALITPQRVLIVSDVPDKKTLVSRLVKTACQGLMQLNAEEITAQVLRREEGVGTALETGLAIPHARLEELDGFAAALAVLSKPLKTPPPGKPVRVMFLFLSPACPAFFPQHLRLLSSVAETFQTELVEELASLKDPAQIAARLKRANMIK